MSYMQYFLILFFSSNLYYTQNSIADTLSQSTYLELEDKFYSYKDNNKIEESRIIAHYYLKKAKKEKKYDNIAEGYVLMHYNKNLSIALKYIDSLNAVHKNFQDDRYPARIYLLKGMLYYNFDNQKLALNNFINALKYAKEKNNERQVAIADIQIAFLNNYIGKHHEAAKVLQHYYDNNDYLGNQDIEFIRINLASVYLDINENAKAINLINEGLQNTLKNKEKIQLYNNYLKLLGAYYLYEKKYNRAILILEKSKKYFLKSNADLDANYAMLYLGQSYDRLHEKEKTTQNFVKIDSIVQKTNNTFPELREVYTYLIDYYKEKKDKEKQLYYIERFLKVDKVLDSQFRYISRELPKKYDTPKLLKEKENIIHELKNKRYLSYSTIGVLCIFLFTLVILFYKSRKAEKKYRKAAQNLINSVNKNDEIVYIDKREIVAERKIQYNQSPEKAIGKTVSDDIIKNILQELEKFENQKLYLEKGVTLSNLSKDIKTNSTYLSDVINTYKKKNFAGYLNDLRIEYALKRLIKDKKFRSYKIPVIAEELGYNNEQAFAMAFKKKTGTTLMIYIKEINKEELQKN